MNSLRVLGARSRLVVERACWVAMALSAVIVVLLIGIVSYEVVARYVFDRPTSWSMEISMHVLVAPVFLAAGYTLLAGGHISMESVGQRLPKRARAVTNIVTSVIALPFLGALTWNLFALTMQTWQRAVTSVGVFPVPLSPVYFTMTVGCFLFVLALLVRISDYAMSLRSRVG